MNEGYCVTDCRPVLHKCCKRPLGDTGLEGDGKLTSLLVCVTDEEI